MFAAVANRSYLYSADALPTAESIPSPIRCVSEHNWAIPLAHHLLAGRGTQIVPSMIWNPRIGIGADYDGGAELLLDLLRVVGEGELDDREEFDRIVGLTRGHLDKQRAKHFLLETGEMVSMGGDDVEEAVASIVEHDIPDSVRRAEAAIAGGEEAWVASLRAEWGDHFASFYADHLYFSFPDSSS